MIRLKNLRPVPSTYEIPISAGFGSVRHTVHTIKYSLKTPVNTDGVRSGSVDLKAERVEHSRQFPKSITLMARGTKGDTSDPLPDDLRNVEPFKSLLTRRLLALVEVPEDLDEAPAPAVAPTASKEDPGEAGKTPDAPTDVPPAASGTDGIAPAETTTDAPSGRTNTKRGK